MAAITMAAAITAETGTEEEAGMVEGLEVEPGMVEAEVGRAAAVPMAAAEWVVVAAITN
jgi:hypothetical protein